MHAPHHRYIHHNTYTLKLVTYTGTTTDTVKSVVFLALTIDINHTSRVNNNANERFNNRSNYCTAQNIQTFQLLFEGKIKIAPVTPGTQKAKTVHVKRIRVNALVSIFLTGGK